jgi:tetratricopeptide (TPR) repeat protein/uncharacterized caspase-like protein
LWSQTKGVSPNPESRQTLNPKKTYAVVVGISDYQDKNIPDLRYADRDAQAFANFLRSPAGGSLDADHLKLLLNENATAGRIAEALDGLLEQVKEGDLAIIYFSGHGDVERKTVTQPGFLLAWDAPSRVYMGGGTYSLAYLQEIITTLSTQNLAKVLVITDACHAGKLSGSQIGGAQLTSANLARQYASEIKILSCQPNEFSLEGEQWGGGRGCFSYHLVDGLLGLADRNNDGIVTLGELDRYLEDHVTAEAAPQSQVPMLIGNKTDPLARVDPATLASLRSNKSQKIQTFAATDSRGVEDQVLATVDTAIRQLYHSFKRAVSEKKFFSPEGQSADEHYAQLLQFESLSLLHGIMKRNYAAALQDEAQQTLNEWLSTNEEESLQTSRSSRKNQLPVKLVEERMKVYPRCLARAAELLGSDHYMYPALQARKLFFDGFLLARSNRNPDKALGEQALSLFRQALDRQPDQPHVYWQMSWVHGFNLLQPDSLEYFVRRAMELHPNWLQPCIDAAFVLTFKYGYFDRAQPFLEAAIRIDSTSSEVWNKWAVFNFSQKKFEVAEQQLRKAIFLDSSNTSAWNNLGYLYIQMKRHDDAIDPLKKALEIDSTKATPWINLGEVYIQSGNYGEAEKALGKALALDSSLVSSWSNLGRLYNRTRRYEEAEKAFRKGLALDSTDLYLWNNLSFLYINMQRFQEAETIIKNLLAKDPLSLSGLNNLGNVYRETNRLTESDSCYRKAFEMDVNFMPTYLNYALLKCKSGEFDSAYFHLEQAIQKGYKNHQSLQTEPNFLPLRQQSERWSALMKKYFPDQIKE